MDQLIFKFALFFLLRAHVIFSQDRCQTPDRKTGTCIMIYNCPHVLNLLKNPNRSQQDLEMVSRYSCGFEGSDPKVCCPAQSTNTGNNNGNTGINNGNTGVDVDNKNKPPDPSKQALLPTNCGPPNLGDKIVGGNITGLEEFPWMALLEYQKPNGKSTACGGVLISKRYVLTAAHCLHHSSLPSTWHLVNVRLGEYDVTTDPDCVPDGEYASICNDKLTNMPVEETIIHEKYNPQVSGQQNDIALVRLSRDVSFTNFIKPICLPESPQLDSKLTVAGWGQTENRYESSVKLKAQIPLADRESCLKKYRAPPNNIVITETQICAGGERGVDSCRGDSGGPLMQLQDPKSEHPKWVTVGIVSFGPQPCGQAGWPGVYTNVYQFKSWILNKLRP